MYEHAPPATPAQDFLDAFVQIDLRALRVGHELDFDLYIQEGAELVLYRAAGRSLTADVVARLMHSGVQALHVPDAQRGAVGTYFERHLDELFKDAAVPTAAKARAALVTAEGLAGDIVSDPSEQNLRRATNVINAIANFGTTNPLAVRQLVRYLRTTNGLAIHSANTAIYALAIAHRSSARNLNRVSELALAAYLHDVGMSEIPVAVLEKPGPLDADEWALVQRHPESGERIVAETGAFSDRVSTAIRMHHERLDGGGYPEAARGSEIPWEARVTAVAEVFDALSSNRAYRKAIRSFQAIQLMLEGEAGDLDRRIIRELIPALSSEVPTAEGAPVMAT